MKNKNQVPLPYNLVANRHRGMGGQFVFTILQLIRIAAVALLFAPIPLTLRLLLLYVADIIDCFVIHRIWKPTPDSKNVVVIAPIDCAGYDYQSRDKIVDTIVYIVVMAYLWAMHPSPLNYVLLGLLLYRTVGVAQFLRTGDKIYIVRYPDLFREFSLVVALMHDGYFHPRSWITLGAIFLAIAIGKTGVEYYHHIVLSPSDKANP